MTNPALDQRSFTTLVDERFLETLGRAPAGTEPAFAAVRAFIDDWRGTAARLREAYKSWDGESPTIRFLKDEYRYFLRHPDTKELHERTARVYTVLNAVQIPVYAARFEEGVKMMTEWVMRMDRRLIGQDGKSRAELVDAFQNAEGRILPSELGGINLMLPQANGDKKPKKRSMFAPLRDEGGKR